MARSLRLRLQYIPAVKSSLLRNGFPSQKILAEDLGIAQSTVSHFLNGKPVDYANFIEICRGLGQEWRDIADFELESPPDEVLPISAKIAIAQSSADQELAVNLSTITNTKQSIIQPLPAAAPELPGGQVDLVSSFYIDRPPIESRCYETISQPGALIRIKAPRQMGKTSLMARILHHAAQQGSRTVALSFQLANRRVFANSDTFLQWFCASIGQELGMLEQLPKCWELADLIGSNQCCKAYFEQYLLSESSPPLTLGLDESDRLFESPEIADDFFGLLRALHEEAKRRDIWKKFRLIVVHSTEVYIPLDVNKSPFNVGLPIELPEFNVQQVQDLAKRHGLSWSAAEVAELMSLVGGNPYLVRLGMYHISRQDVSLDRLVKESATEAGIYSDHLRRHLWNLEKYGELMEGMREVTSVSQPVRLRSELGFKLNSMGLVKLDGNHCIPRCRLYEEYFRDRLNGK
ncbi:MAG: AAA-like domain-containing protein [Microcoleus sp.]